VITLYQPSPLTPLTFHGGIAGALAPFVLFLAGVSWLGLSGAPDETGFWPVLLIAIALGLFLARDKSAYSEAVIDGMSRRLVMIMLLAWLLAAVLGVLLRESGLVGALVWATSAAGVSGGGFIAVSFLVCVVFSTATGTSLGTILVCTPLLYPAGASLSADPAFLIGSIIAGATFGDNVSPISDTTIASATTQGAKLGEVVRSRLKYAVPAAIVALLVFVLFGGSGAATHVLQIEPDALGLLMLAVPALVLTVLIRQRHLVEGLIYGIVSAAVLGLALRRFSVPDLLSIDHDNFIATGLLLDGMRRAVGVSIFTVLLMGLVGGLEAAGLLDRLTGWVRARATSPMSAEWWIFGTVSGATVLTTHSTVAIVTVGDMARDIGEASGVGANRRANILDIAVCTYPFLLPVFIPTVLAASMTADVLGMPRLSPWHVGLHNVHSWALLAVLVFAIATGWGRTAQGPA
jgi:Na+/H+ antiporter NhaC